ncbi:hypothetical protein BDW68DRAFT_175907 [Aspergillus falconensis]
MADKSLLFLPNELIIFIFYQLDDREDASNLAASCQHLYKLFNHGSNKDKILQSVAWKAEINHLRRISGAPKSVLDYKLEEEFLVIERIPLVGWSVDSSPSNTPLVIEVDYNPMSQEMDEFGIRDLTEIRHRNPGFGLQDALPIFLKQFTESKRWPYAYHPPYRDALSAAAELQIEILEASDLVANPITDLSGERTVIALALHWTVIFNDFYLVNNRAPYHRSNGMDEKDVFERGWPATIIEPAFLAEENDVQPLVRVHKDNLSELVGPSTSRQHRPAAGLHDDAEFGVSLRYIAQISFRLLDTQDPKHWPTVLYILLLMAFFPGDHMFDGHSWLWNMIPAFEKLQQVVRDLAEYYYVCTWDGCLFWHTWNEKAYAGEVGTDQLAELAIEHSRKLYELWRFKKGKLSSLPSDRFHDSNIESIKDERGLLWADYPDYDNFDHSSFDPESDGYVEVRSFGEKIKAFAYNDYDVWVD